MRITADAIPSEPAELRAWRDRTLFRLLLRATRVETTATLERIHRLGYADVTLAYMSLLANLDTEGATISALARRAGITRQAASQQLAEIEARGYVSRTPDPADSRAVLIRQTPKGRALLGAALDIVAGLEADYARELGVAELDALKDALQRLLGRVDPTGVLGRD